MEANDYLERLSAYQQGILDENGNLVGLRNRKAQGQDLYGIRFTAAGNILAPDGSAFALSTVFDSAVLSVTGSGGTGAGEFAGFTVNSLTGTPTIVIYDALSATGTPIMTSTAISALGTYHISGDWQTPGVGTNLVKSISTGLWVVITGTVNISLLRNLT